jgi:hypothetical protein
MRDRKHVWRLLGETLREIGTLTFVLVPLDATFASAPVRGFGVGGAMLLGLLLIGWGILMET